VKGEWRTVKGVKKAHYMGISGILEAYCLPLCESFGWVHVAHLNAPCDKPSCKRCMKKLEKAKKGER
jgi:hypothetical protein